jgi:hypothetical protein
MLYGNKLTQADGGGLSEISGVVATLPQGFNLGEERMYDGDLYKLMYNACNQQINTGYLVARNLGSAAAAGPYSVTVSTTTEVNQTVCGLVKHATATTGTYFWALTETMKNPVAVSTVTAIASTGVFVLPAANGVIGNGTVTSVIGYSVAGAKFHLSLDKKSFNV